MDMGKRSVRKNGGWQRQKGNERAWGGESHQNVLYTLWNCERKLKEIYTHICTFYLKKTQNTNTILQASLQLILSKFTV